tara:strand:+ start:3355 stop:3900 length:546 start_codon:yes stop_codon:yes gene_type:complete
MKRFRLEELHFTEPPKIKVYLIDRPQESIRKACHFLRISEEILLSGCRERSYVDARSMLTALFRYHSRASKTYSDIGRIMNRDHSTAIYSLRKHDSMTTLTKRGKAMHPQYVYTYGMLKEELCTIYDPSVTKKIIQGKEIRMAILPSEVAYTEWQYILDMKFDLVELKNIIDKHPLLNEYK